MLCDYGCGQEARYQFKNGKLCCSKNTSSCQILRKETSQRQQGKKRETRVVRSKPEVCDYGCGQEAKYYFKYSKKYCCSYNAAKCPKVREIIISKCTGLHKNRTGVPSPFKGMKLKDIVGEERAKEISEKIKSKNTKRGSGRGSTIEKEIQRRKKISETLKSNGAGGYRRGSGIGKKGWYRDFWCDSSWELVFVIYHLDHNIVFERNIKKFEYVWKEKIYRYIPDFKYPNNVYIEVKSFLDDQTIEKIKQFPGKLIVLMGKEMKKMFSYVIEKYGKDFIKLYEGKGGRVA